MNIAVISLTERGRKLSADIRAHLNGEHNITRYCLIEHSDESSISFSGLRGIIRKLFDKYDALVFVCAVGIAVRVCASCIVSKLSDPAVIAVDDSGRFAVSVLSGHIGGANVLARQIAGKIGAVPVITTATDSRGLFSPDMFAKANGLVICSMDAAKAVAAAVVDGKPVGFKCAYPHSALPDELTECDGGSIGICVSGDPSEKPFGVTLNLMPANIAVGIGCKKGTSCDDITTHITRVFSDNGLDIRRLSAAATADLKAEEPGLLEFCERFSIPLRTYSAEELMSAPGTFAHSDFVEKTTGADNVCERAAVCAGGTLTLRKTAGKGVTAAAAELPVYIDFERNDDSCCM